MPLPGVIVVPTALERIIGLLANLVALLTFAAAVLGLFGYAFPPLDGEISGPLAGLLLFIFAIIAPLSVVVTHDRINPPYGVSITSIVIFNACYVCALRYLEIYLYGSRGGREIFIILLIFVMLVTQILYVSEVEQNKKKAGKFDESSGSAVVSVFWVLGTILTFSYLFFQ
jgi:hypothetical protein